MPRDAQGVYFLPANTAPGPPNTVIESAKEAAVRDDLAADNNTARPVVAGGTGAPDAPTARTNLGITLPNLEALGKVKRTIYATPGGDTHTFDTNCKAAFIQVCGGGGAGGGANPPANNISCGQGGASGETVSGWIFDPPSTASITVGAGGVGVSGGNGGTGGTSEYNDGTTVVGGLGGFGGDIQNSDVIGAYNGASSRTSPSIPEGFLSQGNHGGNNFFIKFTINFIMSAGGGSSPFSPGGIGQAGVGGANNGSDAGGAGGGGGGAFSFAGSVRGGNGSPGIVVIDEFIADKQS